MALRYGNPATDGSFDDRNGTAWHWRRMRYRMCTLCLSTALLSASASGADELTLPGTAPLQFSENVVEEQLVEIGAYFQRQIAAAQNIRDQKWQLPAVLKEALAALLPAHRQVLRMMLGLESWPTQLSSVQIDAIVSQPDLRVERITIPLNEQLAARGLLFTPRATGRHPLVIVCSDADTWPERFTGLLHAGQAAAWLQMLLARGVTVYVPQSVERTIDHSYCQRIPAAVGQPDSSGKDRRWILYRLGYVVGHTVPGLDVQDVLAAVDYLAVRQDVDPQRIAVAGIGQGGMTAMLATSLDTRIAAAAVADYFSCRNDCWREPVDRRLPGQLLSFGDAEVAALIAPRPLIILRSSASAMPEDAIRNEAARAGRFYQRFQAHDRLVVASIPDNQETVAFMTSALADAVQVRHADISAVWPTDVVSSEQAEAFRNQHFEERLAWLRSLINLSEADRYRRWGLLTAPASEFAKTQAAMLADFRQLVGEVPLDDTTEGQTRTIAQHVVDAIARSGKEVQVIDIRRPPTGFTLDRFDAVMIGASIHMSKHSRQLSEFVRRHIARLNAVPSGFFSVSLSAAGSEKERRTPAVLSRNSSRKQAGI